MLKPQTKLKDQKGFTIIEVLIVLAIAGLILLIVFLAVPALQRNSRNTQRKNDAAHVAGLISEWRSNNGNATLDASAVTTALSGEKFGIVTVSTSVLAAGTAGVTAAPAADSYQIYTNATCNGGAVAYSASPRAVVVFYGLEGSTTSGCVAAS